LSKINTSGIPTVAKEDLTKMPGSGVAALIRGDLKKTSELVKGDPTTPLPLTQAQMVTKCSEIRSNAGAGKDGNVEYDFTSKTQTLGGDNYRLDNVWVKAKDLTTQETESITVKDSNNLNSIVFVGGNDQSKQAFIATQEADCEGRVSELEEFHALTVDVSDANRESGTLTSFNKASGIVHTAIVAGRPNLDPIKALLAPKPFPLIIGESEVDANG
jgi:hypothetical protein